MQKLKQINEEIEMGRKVLNQINVKVLKTVQGPLDSIG